MKQSPLSRRSLLLLPVAAALCGAATGAPGAKTSLTWSRLPDLPVGISGQFAGAAGDRLLVVGGTHFPVPLFEGGKKEWVPTVQALRPGEREWTTVGQLPQPGPSAYGVSAPHGKALITVGGCDAERHYATGYRIRWSGEKLRVDRLPNLPRPSAYLAGARIGDTLYVAGGQETPTSTTALRGFWSLDLSKPGAKWKEREPWPGPGRILPAMGAVDGELYLASGAELYAGPDGKPARRYLRDAYRYRPGSGWERIADLPRPVVAAPCLAEGDRLLVFGGDDGENAARVFELKEKHPGFSREVLAFDPRSGRWSPAGAYPAGLVTTTACRWQGKIVVPGGEDRPGHRAAGVHELTMDTPLAKGYTIPTIDLAEEKDRQVVVDREPGQYLGHPTTVLLEDGKTMLAVYPKGHGRGGIVYKRSTDGGETWSDRLPTPASWAISQEVPTLYRTIDPQGKRRLIMFSGLYPIRMAVSEDDGGTWSELKPIGEYGGIVAMGCLERLRSGDYVAMFHDDGRFFRKGGPRTNLFTLYQTFSRDGGVTWGEPQVIYRSSDIHLCEPGIIRSPDGKQLAVLLRENSRRRNSYVIFSNDEAKTWSAPRELPAALTGDRHTAKYAPDGRLFISFRDTTHESPTKGDWVAWVGRYEDIVQGREGQYRVRLMDNHKGADCAYPGVEVLPDGTFVTTTYGHWTPGEAPYIASVRLKLTELDRRAARKE